MDFFKQSLEFIDDKDSKDLQNILLNNLSYEFHSNRSEIFRKDDYDQTKYKYYIVLKGFCNCLLPK